MSIYEISHPVDLHLRRSKNKWGDFMTVSQAGDWTLSQILLGRPLEVFLETQTLYSILSLGFIFSSKSLRAWDQISILQNHFFRENNSLGPEEASERGPPSSGRRPLWSAGLHRHQPQTQPLWHTLPFFKANRYILGLFLSSENSFPIFTL